MGTVKALLRRSVQLGVIVPFAALLCGPSPALATAILGSDLAGFAVLGASEVTNVPTSTIVGSVGVYPTPSITGFNSSPGVSTSDPQVTGGSVDDATTSGSTDNAMLAQSELTTAVGILNVLSATPLLNPTLGPLGEPSLGPGTYSGASNVTGAFTLQGNGTPNEMWVFLTDGLTFNIGSSVTINDPGSGASVYWVDASSVTITSSVVNPTTLLGNILALTSITVGADATDTCGRLLAQNAAVTLISDTIENNCTAAGLPAVLASSNGLNGGSSTATSVPESVPEPSTLALLGGGLAVFLGLSVRRRRVQLA